MDAPLAHRGARSLGEPRHCRPAKSDAAPVRVRPYGKATLAEGFNLKGQGLGSGKTSDGTGRKAFARPIEGDRASPRFGGLDFGAQRLAPGDLQPAYAAEDSSPDSTAGGREIKGVPVPKRADLEQVAGLQRG